MRVPAILLLLMLGNGPTMADETALQTRLVETILVQTILPDHAALVGATDRQRQAMRRFCAARDAETLAAAHGAFDDLVTAFSRIELYRFGPGQEDNRLARLNFWPDRRRLGMRQVQRILAEQDPSATDPATLRDKSVALQGLPALERILFVTWDGVDQDFMCRYGLAIAEASHTTAIALQDAWQGPQAYLLRHPGPDNPLYRDPGEALKSLLRAATEQLVIVEQQKLGRVLGDDPASANPLAAPFRLSGMTLQAVAANIAASRAVLAHPDLDNLFRELDFELSQAQVAITKALKRPGGIADPVTYYLLQYARIPLQAAVDLHDTRLLPALGLVRGFNALDGD